MAVVLALALVAVMAGCSSPGGGVAKDTKSQKGSSAETGAVYRMQLHKVIDEEGTRKLAFTYLVPDGWKATDTIKWIPNDFMTPEVGSSRLTSADGMVQFDSSSGIWINYGHSPTGDYGQRPPKSVSNLLLQGFKQKHLGVKFEVVTKKDTPVDSLLGVAPPQGRNFGLKGVLKVRFSRDGKSFLTKAQARLDGMQMTPQSTPIGGSMFEGGWRITETLAVTAPANKMDEAMKVVGIVLASSRLDPHFFNTVLQAQKIISDNFYRQQRQIGQISRIISQTNDEISDTIMRSYDIGQAAEDKEISGFDDYIRGVDKYRGAEAPVDLPSGYAHAWADGNGHYIVTDQHGYDPNVGSDGGTWSELQKAR
ncbi:MAG: hypothetical protein ACYC96_04675 [Fimbriimonadaceae bacterium]